MICGQVCRGRAGEGGQEVCVRGKVHELEGDGLEGRQGGDGGKAYVYTCAASRGMKRPRNGRLQQPF